jgi:hypothetical protein
MKPNPDKGPVDLPVCAVEYIDRVVRAIRCRKRVRAEVGEELTAHFEEDLKECADPRQREARARELIEQFGDAKLLATLCRRAKKRCRPLWQKALLRTAQVLGLLVLYLVICSLPLHFGKPTIRVNYVEWLNDRWRPAQGEVENAKRYYDEAARLYVAPPEALAGKGSNRSNAEAGWFPDHNDAEMRLLAQWLADNEPAFEMLRRGAKTPHYWPTYETETTDLSDPIFLAEAMAEQAYRSVGLALRENIAYWASQGDLDRAVDDCLAVWTFGRHMQGKGLLNDQLVGIAIQAVGCQSAYTILHRCEVPPDALERIHSRLAVLVDPCRPVVDLDGERVLWHDRIQRTFTDDGQGGGRALPKGMPYAAGDWLDNLLGVLVFDYPDRRDAEAMVDRYFEQMECVLLRTPYDSGLPDDREMPLLPPLSNTLLALVAPAHRRVAQLAWQTRTNELATLTIVAVFRYAGEHNGYPETLDQLVQAGYLDSLPDDPFGAGPLSCRRTDDGFLLYSWGENLADDGGVQGLGQDGAPRMWADNGDWVFWPLASQRRRSSAIRQP